MGIGTSKGAFYEDEFHYAQSQWDPKYDDNVVTPDQMGRNQELDKTETDPNVGIGLEVSYKPSTPQIDVSRLTQPKETGGSPIPMPEVIAKTKSGIEFTNEDIDQAINVGMSSGPGTMVGVKGISNLVPEVRGKKLSDLGHAQVLEANQINPDDIFTTTGFFRGADGKWRTEIPDTQTKFNDKWFEQPAGSRVQASKDLRDILDHSELYNHHPDLAEMKIHYDEGLQGAFYDPNTRAITLGGKPYQNLRGETVVAAKDKSTLMHEVQHAIQDEEGFAQGGVPARVGAKDDWNAGTFKLKYEDAYKNYINQINPEVDRIYQKFVDAGKDSSVLTPRERDLIDHYDRTRKTYQKYRREADVESQTNYLKLAGETEARNVQNRLDMSETELKSIPPRLTQDFPNREQIIRDYGTLVSPYGVYEQGGWQTPIRGQ